MFKHYPASPSRLITLSSLALLMVACGRSEQSILDQAQSSIDRRDYAQAIRTLEEADADHPSADLKTKLGYAYLGESGVEFSDLVKNVKIFKDFDRKNVAINHLPVIHLEHAPSPENKNLIHAFEVFEQAYPEPSLAPQEVNLLIAALKFSLAVEYYNRLVSIHAGSDVSRATLQIINTKRSLNSLLDALHHLYYSYGKIKRFLHDAEKKPLITIGSQSYFLSERVNFTNFFDFLTHSTEKYAQEEINRRANDPRGVEDLLHALSSNLDWLRGQTPLNNAAITAVSLELIHISSRIAPQDISLKPILNQDAKPIRLEQKDFPAIWHRSITAVNEAWRLEDAQILFDERDLELKNLKKLMDLSAQWANAPETFKNAMPESMVRQVRDKLNTLSSLDVDPNDPASLGIIASYYRLVTPVIAEWVFTPRAVQASSDGLDLFRQTENWLIKNLLPNQ